MKNFIAAIFATVLANTAFAASIAPVEALTCTRDLNPWGQSGSCDCPEDTRYESSIGQCVQGEPLTIAIEGVIQTQPNFADDSTAIVLTNANKVNYQLVMTRMMRAEVEELEAQGLNYRITGEILENSLEIDGQGRPTIIVKDLEILPTFRDSAVQN